LTDALLTSATKAKVHLKVIVASFQSRSHIYLFFIESLELMSNPF
jgi:hypothetical protein